MGVPMRRLSMSVKNVIQWLAFNHVEDLFSDQSVKLLNNPTQKELKNQPKDYTKDLEEKYVKLIGQLPEGIFNSTKSLIEYINSTAKVIAKDSINYSPFIMTFKELKPCRPMKFYQGNIITGREKEIDTILLTLCKKSKRGVILIGDPGVGKTALVQAINARLIQRTVPRQLIGCEILTMETPLIFSKYKEDPIGTIIGILEKASEYDKAILFIDEIHQLLGQRMNDILKPYLTEKIRFIGSTTLNEYHSIITEDTALERRFTIIHVDEPTIPETTKMVIGTKSVFEEHHKCSIPDSLCDYLVTTGSRFLGHRKNPDKSLDLLDIACSIMYEEEIEIKHQEINKTGEFFNDLEVNQKEISSIHSTAGDRILSKKYVDLAISNITGVSYSDIANSLEYKAVCANITNSIFGQDKSIEKLSNIVNIFKHVTYDRARPVSIILLVGPAGVGKKSTARILAKNLFGSSNCFIDYDMSSFKDSFTITELKGAPPGYVGYAKSGSLIKAIRTNPLSVVYLRGIDKAHETIRQYLIDGCRSGKLVDSAEREARLNNSIIIFSITLSDLEYNDMIKGKKNRTMGFGSISENNKNNELQKDLLYPLIGEDLVNICDEVIFFNKLTEADLEKIYNANENYYLKMYQNVDIDSKVLHEEVLKNAKNGHDIISRLSSEVPRQVFKQLTKDNNNGLSKKSVKVSKKNRTNDSQRSRKGLECNQDSKAH